MIENLRAEFEGAEVGVSVAVTGQTVVDTATTDVTMAVDLPGQSVTSGAQLIIVEVWVEKIVLVVQAVTEAVSELVDELEGLEMADVTSVDVETGIVNDVLVEAGTLKEVLAAAELLKDEMADEKELAVDKLMEEETTEVGAADELAGEITEELMAVDVSVTGHTVVETAMIDVTICGVLLAGQSVTSGAQLRMVVY
jgi:hypothetical protein